MEDSPGCSEWKGKSGFEDALLLMMVVTMEGCTVGLNIMAKTVFTNGMIPLVFVTYTNAVATILLLPSFIVLHCKHRSKTPVVTFSQLVRFLVHGFAGITVSQNLSFLGLSYSSPILNCAMGHLIPGFSFLLFIILSFLNRKKHSDWQSPSTCMKVIGTLVSVLGAVLIELYKGPLIRKSSPRVLLHSEKVFIFTSTPDNWILGGVLIASSSFSMALFNIFQVETVTEYPEAIKGTPCCSLVGTILCAILSLLIERDLRSWKLNNNMELIVIVLMALFGVVLRNHVHLWCMHYKGPTYVPLLKPFSIAYAIIFGVNFFPNSLHWGSVIGAVIIGMGYYTVIWGQIKEEDERKDRVEKLDDKVPLLQKHHGDHNFIVE